MTEDSDTGVVQFLRATEYAPLLLLGFIAVGFAVYGFDNPPRVIFPALIGTATYLAVDLYRGEFGVEDDLIDDD